MQTVSTLVKGQHFEGHLLVRQCEVRVSQNGSKFLDAVLCDRTGEISAKAWDWKAGYAPKPLSVVYVYALVNEFMGKLQLKLDTIREVSAENIDQSLLVPTAPESPDSMLRQIYATIDGMQDDDIKLICAAAVERVKDALRYWPAAVSFHHSERSGLLHHTTTMLRAAQALLPLYPFLDADLLLGGVILHDLCKIQELQAGQIGIASEYSKCGQLLGHIVMGADSILQLGRELGANEEIALLLSHMVLAHHNEPDFGSPRRPMFAEAEMLHHLDTLDARMYDMQHALSQIAPGEFTGYMRSLDGRRLYRHAKFKDSATEVSEPND